jgi:single-strand DNA-binding protein
MGSSVNKVILIGNLGKDPELSYSQQGTARTKFSMATSEKFKNRESEWQEETEWHNVVVFGKQAEAVSKYLTKGRSVYVEGKIRTRSWDDEKTGQKRYMTEVVAAFVLFLGGGPRHGEAEGGQPSGGEPNGNVGGAPGDDDIPF